MKKLLGIVVLGLLLSGNAYANKISILCVGNNTPNASFTFSNNSSSPVSHGANALKLENEVVSENFNESVNENNIGDKLWEACWKGYEKKGMKKMFGKMYPNCVKKTKKKESVEESYDLWMEDGSWGYTMTGLVEAEYQGRKVKLGKPMQGDSKKFKVYVKNPKGNVVKVNFGQGGDAKGGTMRIRKSNPKARANFRARHNCDSPGPRHKARYWSCRKW